VGIVIKSRRAWFGFLLLALVCFSANASPLFKNLQTDVHTTLDDYRGQGHWLVVMIWASDCEICKREAPLYEQFHRDPENHNAMMLGITLDGEDREQQAEHFISRYELAFDNLLGEPEVVSAYYQVVTGSRWIGTPSFLIFDPQGELRAKQAGAVEVDIVEQFIVANSAGQ